MATAALVCGIVGLVLFVLFVLPVVALVLGLVAASRAKKAQGPKSGLGRARAGWILGLIGVVGFALFVIAAAAEDDFDDGEVSVHRLEEGDCVDTVDSAVDEEIESLPEQDCDEPHDAEVYLVDRLEIEGDDYPAERRLAGAINDICPGEGFEDYVGIAYPESELEYYVIVPSERSWDFGDRQIVCMAITADGSPLTGSVEGTGR